MGKRGPKPGPRNRWGNPFERFLNKYFETWADPVAFRLLFVLLSTCDSKGRSSSSIPHLVRTAGLSSPDFEKAMGFLRARLGIEGEGHWFEREGYEMTYFVPCFDDILGAFGNMTGYYRRYRKERTGEVLSDAEIAKRALANAAKK